VRSVATSPVVHVASEEGGASGVEARPLDGGIETGIETGIEDSAGALGAASGTAAAFGAGGCGCGCGCGTVCIFCVLKGSFIGR